MERSHTYTSGIFIKDVLARENIYVVYCPTERIVADYFTKPPQGLLFRKMKYIIMGLAPFLMEERVERSTIKTSSNESNVTRNYADVVNTKKVTLQLEGKEIARKNEVES